MAERDDEIMGPDSFGGEDFPSSPAADTLRATVDRGSDRPLEIHVEGDDDATVTVESGPDPRAAQSEPEGETAAQGSEEGPDYLTRDEFLGFARSVGETLHEVQSAIGRIGAVLTLKELGQVLAGEGETRFRQGPRTKREAERLDGVVHGDCGHEERYEKRSSGQTESTRRTWRVTLNTGMVEHVRGPEPREGNLFGPTVHIGEHVWDAGSIISIRPADEDVALCDSGPVNGVKVAAPDEEWNPLRHMLQRTEERAHDLRTIDLLLGMVPDTAGQRERIRSTFSRGMRRREGYED